MICSFLNGIYHTCTYLGNIPEMYGRKILRLCVFQHPENGGLFERSIYKVYKFFTQGICSIGYEPDRAKRGWAILEQLGAKSSDIHVGNHSINAMEWDPKDLEEKIKKLGGSWDRFTLIDGQKVFAILPPKNLSEEWKTLELSLLKFWSKKEGMIITCNSADEVNDDEKLIIQVNSASTSYIMMRDKMALYIGCKKKLVCFDPPGTGLSKGTATEGAYYAAIKAVFERYANSFSPENIWVCGACLGCSSVAYLRSQIPNINLILENGFVNLKEDMVKPEGRFVYWFAKRFWNALSIFEGDAKEFGFDIAKMWESSVHSPTGKIIVVSVKNDQRLSQDVTNNLIRKARQINEKVFHVNYQSSEKDPHFSRFEKRPQIRKEVLHYIFQ